MRVILLNLIIKLKGIVNNILDKIDQYLKSVFLRIFPEQRSYIQIRSNIWGPRIMWKKYF